MNASFSAGRKPVGERLSAKLRVYDDLGQSVLSARSGVAPAVWEGQHAARRLDLEDVPPVVRSDGLDLHSSPSFSRASMIFSSRLFIAPFIASRFSRSNFATSLPSR